MRIPRMARPARRLLRHPGFAVVMFTFFGVTYLLPECMLMLSRTQSAASRPLPDILHTLDRAGRRKASASCPRNRRRNIPRRKKIST